MGNTHRFYLDSYLYPRNDDDGQLMKSPKLRICPYCLKEKKSTEFTKEHLPAKSLYKTKGKNECANSAIISVCNSCNNLKSKLDNEILALYGHPTDIEKAQRAQQSLKSLKNELTADDILLQTARIASQTGRYIGKARGVPLDIVTYWMSLVGPGIYNFFTRSIFEGTLSPHPSVFAHKIDPFSAQFQDKNTSLHKITEFCAIILVSKGKDTTLMASALIKNQDGEAWNFFSCFMHETEDQHKKFHKQCKTLQKQISEIPDINSKLNENRVPPRQIYDMQVSTEKITYRGVERTNKN